MKFRSWRRALTGYAPKYDSTQKEFDGWWRGRSLAHIWRDSSGGRDVPYLYFHDGRKLDLDWCGLDWYSLYRFLAVRNCLLH